MKSSALALASSVLLLTVMSVAQQTMPAPNLPTGHAFLQRAAEINIGEIQLGKLAEAKGNNPAVKDFGKRMIQDHTAAQAKLVELAKQQGVTLPKGPGEQAKNFRHELTSSSGARFDKLYMQHMLSGHKNAIMAFENVIEHGQDQAIKSYAEQVLPVIQDHVRMAEDVAGKMDMAGQQGLHDPAKAIMVTASPK